MSAELVERFDAKYIKFDFNQDMLCDKAEKALLKATKQLTKLRKEQAALLEKAIEEGLKDLNFADVKFEIAFGEFDNYTADGMDDVEFMISLNPGQPVRPLVNVASGGELSRIMLVIKSVMADRDDIDTLIFDEIDAGISGVTAKIVAEKFAKLSKHVQIIAISHLPQIVSYSDKSFLIEKIK